MNSKCFDIQKPNVSSIISCQIRIHDDSGACRSKQRLQRVNGQHWRSPLMVF